MPGQTVWPGIFICFGKNTKFNQKSNNIIYKDSVIAKVLKIN